MIWVEFETQRLDEKDVPIWYVKRDNSLIRYPFKTLDEANRFVAKLRSL